MSNDSEMHRLAYEIQRVKWWVELIECARVMENINRHSIGVFTGLAEAAAAIRGIANAAPVPPEIG